MQSLMAHALIDELKLMIDPLTVGGKRLCHDDGALGNTGRRCSTTGIPLR